MQRIISPAKLWELIREHADDLGVPVVDASWNSFQAWAKESGHSLMEIQRGFSTLGGFNAVRDAMPNAGVSQLAVEKRKVSTSALANRADRRAVADEAIYRETFEELIQRAFRGRVKAFKPRKKATDLDRDLTLVLSDLHIGADIDGKETGSISYGATEQGRRIARVVCEAANYKTQYRDRTSLTLLLIGDIINGVLHDKREGCPLAEQQVRAIHFLSQAIAYLASSFPRVVVRCQPGNHGRDVSRHKERAVLQKWDSHETVVYHAVRYALSGVENVSFDIPTTPFVRYKTFGFATLATHSDTVMSSHGYVGNSVNVSKLEHAIDRLNSTLPDGDKADVVIVGHSHVPLVVQLPNGVFLINNGSTEPLTSHVGTMNRAAILNNSQTLFESTPRFAVGDLRHIRVSSSDDVDAGLDQIIEPWGGM